MAGGDWALLALLLALPPACPRAAPGEARSPCAHLAAKYAYRYRTLIEGSSKFRALVIRGDATPLSVWGARRGPAAAAAALLHAALRHALGYDAALQRRPYDDCLDESPFSVAPVAVPCGTDEAALGAPLVARVTGRCARLPTLLLPRDALHCDLMTFLDLNEFILNCNISTTPCSSSAGSSVAVLADAEGPRAATLERYICNSSGSLTIVRFDNTSCFRDTLQRLYDDDRNLSFLFLSQDLSMYRPGVLTVKLHEGNDFSCPPIFRSDYGFKAISELDMKHYAPQILDIVERFCPQFKDLEAVLNMTKKGDYDIETASCDWALRNNHTFESWITTTGHDYTMYVYLCSDDPHNDEYEKTLLYVKKTIKQEYNFTISFSTVDCNSAIKMLDIFRKNIENNKIGIMGVLTWSSSAGSSAIANLANKNQLPVVLAGPVADESNVHSGSATVAVDGRLDSLADAYRRFLKKCNWSRLAILSDGSSYADFFKNALIKRGGIVQIEKKITPDNINDTLRCLKNDHARIFIVNANSTLATKVLLSATQSDMTPTKGYAWIVREWHPAGDLEWASMSHFSLGWAWRGDEDGPACGCSDGSAELRAQLRTRSAGRAWPALVAPLVDAMLVLYHSFAKFHLFYSSNSFHMQLGGYAVKFSKIYEKIKIKGVARHLRIHNGTYETSLIYVERWLGANRTVLATWPVKDIPFEEQTNALCGLLVPDRPPCILRGGDVSDFVQKCYDPLLYTLVVVFILLPGVFLLARRARLQRLKRRDLKMLANLFEKKQSISNVHQDSLYIHKEIGTGNFGCVYLATLRRRPRRSQEKSLVVAAKALRNDSDKGEYLQEARILEFLDHKNIIKFVGIYVSNGSRFILMEYALHGDLHNYLKSRRHLAERRQSGACDESEAAHVSADALTRLAGEAAAALQYLARRGLVHRDVRAANCLLDERRTLKLADFGMARRLCRDRREYTTIRQALFPVLWMAPESLIYGTFSTASDVWALGMLFFELSTLGRRPYGDWSPQRVLEFVRLGGRPSLPPDMSSQTRSLLAACWQQEAAARPSAAELARFLAREPLAVRPSLLTAGDSQMYHPPEPDH